MIMRIGLVGNPERDGKQSCDDEIREQHDCIQPPKRAIDTPPWFVLPEAVALVIDVVSARLWPRI